MPSVNVLATLARIWSNTDTLVPHREIRAFQAKTKPKTYGRSN